LRSTDFTALNISIAEIKQGGRHFSFHVPSIEEIREGASFSAGMKVEADVQIVGDDFWVDLDVSAEGEFVCDRCGRSFRQGVSGRVHTLFSAKPGFQTDDEVRQLQASDRILEIGRDALDALILALPVKVVCAETCKGLCPSCGADLNVEMCSCRPDAPDSPWDALRNIRFDMNEKF
jgi:uncharacterized protein